MYFAKMNMYNYILCSVFFFILKSVQSDTNRFVIKSSLNSSQSINRHSFPFLIQTEKRQNGSIRTL